jgi:iron complex outermembrane recepter protein
VVEDIDRDTSCGVKLVVVAIALILTVFNSVCATETVFRLDIPELSASDALDRLAKKTGHSLFYPTDDLSNVITNALDGTYTLPEALDVLLKGTHLDVVVTRKRVIVISITSKSQNISSDEGSEMKTSKKKLSIFTVIAALFSTTAPLTATGQSETGTKSFALEEIVVTAQRREQSLQDVPISVSVFSSDKLEQLNINEGSDFLRLTPNVSFTEDGEVGSRGLSISIRGVSNLSTGETATTNSFGYYIDDLNVAASANFVVNPQLLDVERIEVLRGPQGTHFGRNTSGGAINVTTKKPDSNFYAEISGFGERFDAFGGSAIINLPVTDKLMLRSVLSYEEGDGTVRNITPGGTPQSDFDYLHMRHSVRALISDNLTLDFSYTYTDENQGLDENVPSGVLDIDTRSFPFIAAVCNNAQNAAKTCANDSGTGFFPDNRKLTSKDADESNDNRFDIVNLRLNWEGERYQLKSITGYMDSKSSREADLDGTDRSMLVRLQERNAETFSQEIQIHSRGWEDVDWVVGGIYAKDEFTRLSNVTTGTLGFGPFPPGNIINLFTNTFENESWAVFGDLTWSLSEKFSLTGGIRYSEDTIDVGIKDRITGIPGAGGTAPLPGESVDASFSDVSFRVAANYYLNDDTSVYATISSGYKAGGTQLNQALGTVVASNQPFDEESVLNYEIGIKATLLDKRLRFSASAFYLDWDDLQIESFALTTDATGAILFTTLTQNAASAQNWGIEAEVEALLTDELRIGGGVGYLDSEFKNFTNASVGTGSLVDLSGQRLPKTPEWTLNLFGEYRRPILNSMEGWIYLDFSHAASSRSDLESVAAPLLGLSDFPYNVPSYEVVNLRVGIEDERWSVTGYIENLFDKNYYTGTRENFGFSGIRIRPHRQVFGAKFTYKFF